ncbi:MAG: diacylglycerol kinase family protein [Chloroflexaceae bacterium]|nr:diacylglycerol kinase family protein [Chloroflexaceae bacterium]
MQALLASFAYALTGLGYLLRTQRNARIHVLVGACALFLGALVRLDRCEWLILVLTIAVVLACEGLNTALEVTVNLITCDHHPLAGLAKDVAAGAVLLCALASVVIGGIIFLPHLWPLIRSGLNIGG